MIDLHIHTTASDGQYTPTHIVRMASDAGLSLIAITDHDTVSGIAEGSGAAQKAGLGFIPGIEISVSGDNEIHILGYNIDIGNARLTAMCDGFAENRRQRGTRIIEYLQTYGVDIRLEQAQEHAGTGNIGRPHFARAMVDAGYVKTVREAFDKYLGIPEFKKIERPKPTPQEGIETIIAAGGVAVLAHPVQLKMDDSTLEKLLAELTGYGLGGLECWYSTHTPQQTKLYLALAKKYKLAVTGGSDFHGEAVKPGISLGSGIEGSLCIERSDLTDSFLR